MKVCLVQRLEGVGGPAAFQRRLLSGLTHRKIDFTFDLDDTPFDAALVINASRSMGKLRRRKREGVRIVQRLGGLNWQHKFLRMSLTMRLQASIRNMMMRVTRSLLADQIIYQSKFVKTWWETAHGPTQVPNSVIHNGVDLTEMAFCGKQAKGASGESILSVEGTQGIDPFRIAERTTEGLAERGRQVLLTMFGQQIASVGSPPRNSNLVTYGGQVPQNVLPDYYRRAQVFISTDVIAACPNSVIESLACGTPVVGYDAGALPELVGSEGGICIEPKANPLKGHDPGNSIALVDAAEAVIEGGEKFRKEARERAESQFDVDMMVDRYLAALG